MLQDLIFLKTSHFNYLNHWLHPSVSHGGGFVNKMKKASLEVFVLLLKNCSFLYMKSIHFSKAEKARNKMEV